jgi:predicted NBD/HSP70 family sugar kinase
VQDFTSQSVFVDIGATWMRFAPATTTVLTDEPSLVLRTPKDANSLIEELRRALLATMTNGADRLSAFIACAGRITRDGTIAAAVNLPAPVAVAAKLTRFNVDAVVMNDAQVQAWGAATGKDSFLYICFGTGVGGAIVLDGRPHLGVNGMAGEVGHLGVGVSGPRCPCGRRGCLDQYSSGKVLARKMGDSWWLSDKLDVGKRTVLRRAATATGVTATALMRAMDVDRVVLGGSLTKNSYWREHVCSVLAAHINPADVDFLPGTWDLTVSGLDKVRRETYRSTSLGG